MTQQETIVLAYDGSEEARHAISVAAGPPLDETARSVLVVWRTVGVERTHWRRCRNRRGGAKTG